MHLPRRWNLTTCGLLAAGLWALAGPALVAEADSRLANPTRRAYQDELVRLMTPAPGAAGSFVVKEDGAEVPYQVEEIEGQRWVWVSSHFDPTSSHTYQVTPGKPAPAKPRLTVRREGGAWLLDNGLVAAKVPAEAGGGIPGPISAVRLGDRWVGGSRWRTSLPLRQFTAALVGDGTLFGKVRLRYEFDGQAGLDGRTPAFAEVDVALGPGWSHLEIAERHEMARGDYWELEASHGWSPSQGVSRPFGGGAGSGEVAGKVEPRRALKPGGLPCQRPDLFINLFPRWNQHYKDGWCFAATDGERYVGAVVVRASRWEWPHDNSLRAVVRESGDYAGLEAPTWKGRRLWWLFAPSDTPASTQYVARYAWEALDRLNHEFILDWPGRAGDFPGMNYYDGGQVNPTGGLRRAGRSAIADAAKPGDLATLLRAQVMMHPDAFGSYRQFWSPENPNFFTDFMRVPIAMTARLREHPHFEDLRRAAEATMRQDVDHSVTLPGGAGQECPGYLAYALGHWTELAPVCRQFLGFDPTTWERYGAAQRFLRRISQPDGDVRRALPMGDTHPAKEGGPAVVEVPPEEVRRFVTEELPGFGVVFSHRPGTPRETYLAFKSGPNRGHYHGDQLALHYGANARPLAVDHHCSYNPRAGQEHMHNRVAFHTDAMPYANMDGYERLIAFKTSADADIAVGQVESDRLRQVQPLPPEIWHQEYPQHRLSGPLVYRRTVVLVKGGPQDYVVLRDQFRAPEPLGATYCLHVLADGVRQDGPTVDFGPLTLFCAEPARFEWAALPWSHENGGHEATQGARLTVRGDRGQFITVLYPGRAPAMAAVPGGVRVGEDEVLFSGDLEAAGAERVALVKRGGREGLVLLGSDIRLDRPQGEVGLFVPDAGYPFGDIPDWLIRQRAPVSLRSPFSEAAGPSPAR